MTDEHQPPVSDPTSAPVTLRDVRVKLLTLPVAGLHPYPRNVRRAAVAELDALQDSLRQHGLINPLVGCRARGVPTGSYWVLDGNHRLICLRNLGVEAVPVKLYDAELTDEQIAVVMVVQDTTKTKLTPRQTADIARDLLASGQFRTAAEVARFLSLKPAQLSLAFRTRDHLAPELQDRADLPLTVKHALAAAPDADTQRELVALYDRGLLTRDAVVAEVARRTAAARVRKPKPVAVRVGKSEFRLTGTPAEVKGELETLLKAVSKAESLGLGVTAVPDLTKGGAK